MKIPKHIKNKMKSAARHYQIGSSLMQEINDWFEKNGYPPEQIRTGDGYSLEEIEYGNDMVDIFCVRFEEGEFDK